jgi:hypothetical protein
MRRTSFSLRSVLLIALVVSLDAGTTAFAIGHGLSGITSVTSSTSPSQQSTTTSTETTSTVHQCNETDTG